MDNEQQNFVDTIVIGAGHAGCEAGLAAARMGCKTLMFTVNYENIGNMPCNPAIGGPAKGQMVSEIDALGGEMGLASDHTFIQMRVLNSSRGPAVQCLRAQNDKKKYADYLTKVVENEANLIVKQATINDLIVENDQVIGVITELGKKYFSQTVIITTGTFLKGKIHIGMSNFKAGRMGEPSAENLSDSLQKLGLKMGRLKTGTTPRLDARSLDYSKMIEQKGDYRCLRFSYRTPLNDKYKDQISCYLTHTNEATHEIIEKNIGRSPMYQGVIKGTGPRYCPSIEDKIMRFRDKTSHQLFMEPEGADTIQIYAQGLNTSMPEDVQEDFLKTIPGLENVKVIKPGYAVEYDFVYPNQLLQSLEVISIKNLFLAGQINGTSGYEEAAGQGIIAGINAALSVQGKKPLILKREESYIGTMIDDLTTKNVIHEPYRMLSSRSEYRLLLRQDNAIFRLSRLGHQVGLVSDDLINRIESNKREIDELVVKASKFALDDQTLQEIDTHKGSRSRITAKELLRRPEINIKNAKCIKMFSNTTTEDLERVMVEIKYEGYITKQTKEILKLEQYYSKSIPEYIDYDRILGLKEESREKLKRYKPKTFFEAKKIAGINPTDIGIVMVYSKKL